MIISMKQNANANVNEQVRSLKNTKQFYRMQS